MTMEEAGLDKKRSASFWFFAVATAALFIASCAILVRIFTSGDHLAAKALLQGQRVIIAFETGVIEGNAHKPGTDKPKPSTLTPPQPDAQTEPAPPKTPDATPDLAVPMQPVEPPTAVPPSIPDSPATMSEPQTPASRSAIAIPQVSRGTNSLALAPFKPITETVGDFTLPRIAPETKEVPWQYYGKDIAESKRPMIAILITGLGQSRIMTDSALALAPLFTLSFSPYAKDSPLWVINARNKGFETWVDLSVEPLDYPASDPGPHAVLDDKGPDDNLKNLRWVLSRFQGYAGAVIPVSEKLTPNDTLAMTVAQEISTRGIQLTYLQTPQNTAFTKQARSGKQLVVPADAALDDTLSSAEILNRLEMLVQKAKKDGQAVGMIRAYPVSLETLKNWMQTLKESGVDLVPLTAIAKKTQ